MFHTLNPIKEYMGYTISFFHNRYTVFVCGEEVCFDTMKEAEHFISSGEASKMEMEV